MKKFLAACLVSAALLGGCSGEEEGSADAEGCAHLQKGPGAEVTATATASGAPAVSNDHKRYDITLVEVNGEKVGSVSFASSEATDYIFYLSADVRFSVADSSGNAVDIEESATSSAACDDIKGRHVVPLGVGTYTLSFGPTSVASVSLVAEAHEHDHDHDHGHEH